MRYAPGSRSSPAASASTAFALADARWVRDVEDLAETPAEDVLSDLEEAFDVHEAMAGLPENCRQILDSFFAKDESYRTIGDSLGLPAGTIASRISRCLDKLRTAFEGRNEPALPSGEQVT